MGDYSEDGYEFLEQILTWLKKALERTPAENRRWLIETTRYWRLGIRLPFLYQYFLSDLWVKLFDRIGCSGIWNVGDLLIRGDVSGLMRYLSGDNSLLVIS